MARAINADALKTSCKITGEFMNNFECVSLATLGEIIDKQPTIEPRLEWIGIVDDLPKPGMSLLCVGRHGGLFVVKKLRAEDIKAEGRIWSYGSGWRWFTHWMELPKLPREDG